jgi:hypothetical protein
MEITNNQFIYLLGVNVKHSAPRMPNSVDYRHIIMAQKSVSFTSALHNAALLRISAVTVNPIPYPISMYYHKTPEISFLLHLFILHSSIVALRAQLRHVWTSRI